MGSLLRKIYSGLLHEVQLWVTSLLQKLARTLYVQMAYKRVSLKPWVLSKQRSTSIYNCSRSNSSGCMGAGTYILQVINTLHSKGFGHTRLNSLCTAIANGSWILCQCIQTSILSITSVQMLMYTRKLCVKYHSCEFLIVWILNF